MNTATNATRTVTVNSKFGQKSVETTLTAREAVKVITDQANPSGFALDLVRNHSRYGLSVNQENWLVFLAQEYLDKQNKPQSAKATGPVLPNASAIVALFGKAHLNLKYPRLRLQTADGRLVVIKLSGQASKHCGSLNLTNGVKYGENGAVFYGYVHQDGTYTVQDQGVIDLLVALANDPAKVTASQGLASGSCCFCGRDLSDSEDGSSEIGYGPICADHWGLPWARNGQAEVVEIGATPVVAASVKPKRTRKTKLAKALALAS